MIRSGLGIPESSISTTRIELRMARQGERIKSYKISRNTNRELYDVSIVIDSKEFFASA